MSKEYSFLKSGITVSACGLLTWRSSVNRSGGDEAEHPDWDNSAASKKSSGIALKNVYKRRKLFYNEKAYLDIESKDIKSGRSEIRNKIITRFFKEPRFIEEWGTGIRRILSECRSAGLQEPDFIETGMHFKVVIYRHSSVLVMKSSGSGTYDYSKLSRIEKAIISYLQINKSITNKEGVQATSLSPAGVRKVIIALQKKGKINAVGEGRSRYYILNEKKCNKP